VAYRGGKIAAETVQRTAGTPSRLQLTTDNAALKASRTDLALVTMAVMDDRGTLVPDADSPIALALTGPACFLGCENGDPVDITPQRESWRRAFAGLARAFYSGRDGVDGAIEVAALGILGRSYFADTATVPVVLECISLRGNQSSGKYEIRYTVDGTEPVLSSPVYDKPLVLNTTATVRATAFLDGRPVVSVSGKFTRGSRPVWIPPEKRSSDQGAAEDPSHEKTIKKAK